jgi:hypothetical protein
MNLFDDENIIIEHFQRINDTEVFFPHPDDETVLLYRSIHETEEWSNWIYSAGKDDPPPDYYNEKMLVMMDVMRVDDHAFLNEKGKVVNPTNAKESKLRKELDESGILEYFSNCKEVFISAKTVLPTEEDHNYRFYNKNFVRVVTEHARKLDLYKRNHPGYKTVFFVMDESSAYFRIYDKLIKPEEGKCVKGAPHLFFYDKSFIEMIKNTPIDYLIWYAPFKLLRTNDGIFTLPQAVIYNIHEMDFEDIEYDQSEMRSNEV